MNRATYWAWIGVGVTVYNLFLLIPHQRPISISEGLLAAIAIPRLHDIGRSGWIVAAPIGLEIVSAIAAFTLLPLETATMALGLVTLTIGGLMIWLGVLRGQSEPNRYGDPPPPELPLKSLRSKSSAIVALAAVGTCAAAAVAASTFVVPMLRADAQDETMTSSFVADPNNTTTVVVRGWQSAELNRILGDFARQYDLPDAGQSEFRVAAAASNTLKITFPRDIEPRLLYFLVNYLYYHNGFDLSHRSIEVVAHMRLSRASGAPSPALLGQEALIYVPANDTDYDRVYVQIRPSGAYQITFTDLIWRPVEDARVPSAIAGL